MGFSWRNNYADAMLYSLCDQRARHAFINVGKDMLHNSLSLWTVMLTSVGLELEDVSFPHLKISELVILVW